MPARFVTVSRMRLRTGPRTISVSISGRCSLMPPELRTTTIRNTGTSTTRSSPARFATQRQPQPDAQPDRLRVIQIVADRVQGRGARPGVDLGLHPPDAPGGEVEALLPADHQRPPSLTIMRADLLAWTRSRLIRLSFSLATTHLANLAAEQPERPRPPRRSRRPACRQFRQPRLGRGRRLGAGGRPSVGSRRPGGLGRLSGWRSPARLASCIRSPAPSPRPRGATMHRQFQIEVGIPAPAAPRSIDFSRGFAASADGLR